MSTRSDGEVFLTNAEFDALYARVEVSDLSLDLPVWELPGPREAVVRWHDAGVVTGHVLDAGCGSGSNAVWLAAHGHPITGFDASPNALRIARTRAAGLPAQFLLADALTLDLPDRYDTILDSTLYHCLPFADRQTYLRGLGTVSRPAARLLMICVSDSLPPTLPGPARITRTELQATLPPAGWTITDITPSSIPVSFTLDLLRSVCETTGLPEPTGDEVEFDNGLALFPTWEVVAERRELG